MLALVVKLAARPALPDHGEHLVQPPAAGVEVEPEAFVLVGPVAEADSQHRAPAGYLVQHGRLLGDGDRMMQRGEVHAGA